MKGGHIEKVESALRDAGPDVQTGTAKKMGGITVDREVVSGANPFAVKGLGAQFVQMLSSGVEVKNQKLLCLVLAFILQSERWLSGA